MHRISEKTNQYINLYIDYVIPDRLWTLQTLSYLSFEEMWNLKIMTQVIYHEAYGFLEIKKTAIWKESFGEKMLNNTQNAIYF